MQFIPHSLPEPGFIQNLSPVQLFLVFFLILLLFGAKRLPELGRGLGKFIREFKKTTHEIEEDIRSSIDDEPPRSKPEKKPAPSSREKDAEKVEVNSNS